MKTVIIIIICLFTIWKWEWVKERVKDLLALYGWLLRLGILVGLVWLGAYLPHYLFGINYIIGGVITLTIIILWRREN